MGTSLLAILAMTSGGATSAPETLYFGLEPRPQAIELGYELTPLGILRSWSTVAPTCALVQHLVRRGRAMTVGLWPGWHPFGGAMCVEVWFGTPGKLVGAVVAPLGYSYPSVPRVRSGSAAVVDQALRARPVGASWSATQVVLRLPPDLARPEVLQACVWYAPPGYLARNHAFPSSPASEIWITQSGNVSGPVHPPLSHEDVAR